MIKSKELESLKYYNNGLDTAKQLIDLFASKYENMTGDYNYFKEKYR